MFKGYRIDLHDAEVIKSDEGDYTYLSALYNHTFRECESVFWDSPNLKFVLQDRAEICDYCQEPLSQLDCRGARLYVRDISDKNKDLKVATTFKEGNFLIVVLANTVIQDAYCSRCTYDNAVAHSEDKEEGPYGGAFRNMNDYYTWKNGSGFCSNF